MATVIGHLSTLVSMNAKAYESGTKKVKKLSKEAKEAMEAAGIGAESFGKRLLKTATITGAAVGAMRMLSNEAERLENSLDVGDRLGITNRELEGLRLGAHRVGIEANVLDMALQRMTRRISEAAIGTGEAQGALEELGLNPVKLNAIGAAAAFREIADAMRMVENPADRLRLSFKLFDSEGADLVRLLEQGSDGLREMREEAEKLGLSLDKLSENSVRAAIESQKKLENRIARFGRWMYRHYAIRPFQILDVARDTADNLAGGRESNTSRIGSSQELGAANQARFRFANPAGGGVTDPTIPRADPNSEAVKRFEALKALREKERQTVMERGRQIRQEFAVLDEEKRTNAQRRDDRIKELREIRMVLGPAFENTFRRALKKAHDDFEKAEKDRGKALGDPGTAGAGGVGSLTAFRIRFMQPLQETKKTAEKTEKNTKDTVMELREIKNKLPTGVTHPDEIAPIVTL